MVCDQRLFIRIEAKIDYPIKVPNGTTVRATQLGAVKLTNTITLLNVLSVLEFSFNLIFAKKLTKDSCCCHVFLIDPCYIQDLTTWNTIGRQEKAYIIFQDQSYIQML